MEQPLITIAIPFYSNVEYLKRAVGSVLAQNQPHFVLNVSDDFGPCGAEAQAYLDALQDPRISYIRQRKNLGLADNWNYCLESATTDLVCLLHADDKLLPAYLEGMLDVLARHREAALAFCQADIIGPDDQPVFSVPDYVKHYIRPRVTGDLLVQGDEGLASLLRGCYIMCPTICYRRSQLGDARFSANWRMVCDLEFYARLLFTGKFLVGTPQTLYQYRRHTQNQTALLTESMHRFEEEVAVYNWVAREAYERGWPQTTRVGKSKWIIHLNLAFCILRDFFAMRWKKARTKLKFWVSVR